MPDGDNSLEQSSAGEEDGECGVWLGSSGFEILNSVVRLGLVLKQRLEDGEGKAITGDEMSRWREQQVHRSQAGMLEKQQEG